MCQTLPPRPMTSVYKNGGEEAVWFTRLDEGQWRFCITAELSDTKEPDVGIKFDLKGAGIPLFFVKMGVTKGKVYPMLLHSKGSAEIRVINIKSSLIVYLTLTAQCEGFVRSKDAGT